LGAAVETVIEAGAQVADLAADPALHVAELRDFPLCGRIVRTIIRICLALRFEVARQKRRAGSCESERKKQTAK
jgi:hypothetical protein